MGLLAVADTLLAIQNLVNRFNGEIIILLLLDTNN
uniref:Uncharacterized protein n=1 Tax=Anguilla anguilla TaxID=7936 RepID=A0A0E9XCD5_ANGAN